MLRKCDRKSDSRHIGHGIDHVINGSDGIKFRRLNINMKYHNDNGGGAAGGDDDDDVDDAD